MRECRYVCRRLGRGERLSPNPLSRDHGNIFGRIYWLTDNGSSTANRARAARAWSRNGALRAVA